MWFLLAIKIFERKSMRGEPKILGWCSFVAMQSGSIAFNSIWVLISSTILVRQLKDLILIIGLDWPQVPIQSTRLDDVRSCSNGGVKEVISWKFFSLSKVRNFSSLQFWTLRWLNLFVGIMKQTRIKHLCAIIIGRGSNFYWVLWMWQCRQFQELM